MQEAGIDTSRFKAHSVRGDSTTAAMEKGVALAEELRTADWSSDTTFRHFYYHPGGKTAYSYQWVWAGLGGSGACWWDMPIGSVLVA